MIHALLAATAVVTTLAGTPGVAGNADGAANIALFNKPTHVAIDYENGDIYIVDRINAEVRKLSNGTVSSFNVYQTNFYFDGPMGGGIAVEPPADHSGAPGVPRKVFVSSSGAHVVVQADVFGALPATHDYDFVGEFGVAGDVDTDFNHTLTESLLNTPTALAIDRRHYAPKCCAPRYIYIADTANGSVRKLMRTANIEGEYQALSLTTVARGFIAPRGVAFGADGSFYVSDAGANTITRFTPDFSSRTIIASEGLNMPTGIDVDDLGNVYIADTGNSAIRVLRPNGVLETVAGMPGEGGWADGAGSEARFNGPVGLQLAADGSLIVADTSNQVIRKITFVAPPLEPRRRGVRH